MSEGTKRGHPTHISGAPIEALLEANNKKLEKRLAEAEAYGERMFELKMAWQRRFYRLKSACEAGIEEGLQDAKDALKEASR